jgi:hypothetical protein
MSSRRFPADGLDSLSEHNKETEQNSSSGTPPQATGVFAERHYTVAEIAAMWNLSKDAVRRIFQNEPGVLVLGSHSSARKRRYTTLRVPQSTMERVHHKYEIGN